MSMMSPWLSIVLLGAVISGYAWMIPKAKARAKETEFASEAAYNQLLEDLESENRELLDAVAKFKQEQDLTVEKLGRRIVDMEQQLSKWSEHVPSAVAPTHSQTPILEASLIPTHENYVQSTESTPIQPISDISALHTAAEAIIEEIVIPPTTIRGRYPELLEMNEKGRSVEQIAKAMGMNKGEVQLILQLVRREELQDA